MAEYIEREALLRKIRWADTAEDCVISVNRMPLADVAPAVHGKWLDNERNGYGWAFLCSNCGWVDGFPFNDRYKYCPHCGAKMDEV